jgi:hypothetical protein
VLDTAEFSSTGSGTLTGTQDQNASGTLSPDVALTGSYTVSSAGRVAVTPAAGGPYAAYIVSPTKALLINLSSSNPAIQELLH